MAKKKRKKIVEKKRDIGSMIKPVTELMTNLVMLVYGRSGSGKTEFGSTFPTPILFVDIKERGTETIAHKKGIDLIKVTTWGDFDELYWFLLKGTKYKSIVLDQISNLQDMGMAEIRTRTNKTSDELFTQKNWGQLSGLLKETIQNFRELADQYHICLIAHERTFDGGDDEDDVIAPTIGARVIPSVGSFIDGAVDAIGNTFIRETFTKKGGKKERRVDYCMRTGPHAYYTTKVRRPVDAGPLPESIVDPTYRKVANLIAGKSITQKKVTKKVRRKKNG